MISCLLPFVFASLASIAPGDDLTGFSIIPDSCSPKGTYVLAYSVLGRSKINWPEIDRLHHKYDGLEQLGLKIRCDVRRTKDMSRVKTVSLGVPWGLGRTDASTIWSPREDMLFTYETEGGWYPDRYLVVLLDRPTEADQVNIVKPLRKSLDRYLEKLYPKFYGKHHYVFYPVGANFPNKRTMNLKLHVFVPRAMCDFGAQVEVRMEIPPNTHHMTVVVKEIRIISVDMGTHHK